MLNLSWLFHYENVWIIWKQDFIGTHLSILPGFISLVSSSWYSTIYNSYWVWSLKRTDHDTCQNKICNRIIYTWVLMLWFMLTFSKHLLCLCFESNPAMHFPHILLTSLFDSWCPQLCELARLETSKTASLSLCQEPHIQ